MDKGQVVLHFAQKSVLKYVFSDLSSPDFQIGHQELGIILENKVFQKSKFSKNVNNQNRCPKLIFFDQKKLGKIQIIFNIKNGFESQI